eukprot:2040511-Pleurochrysis_carterae.AAC.2
MRPSESNLKSDVCFQTSIVNGWDLFQYGTTARLPVNGVHSRTQHPFMRERVCARLHAWEGTSTIACTSPQFDAEQRCVHATVLMLGRLHR